MTKTYCDRCGDETTGVRSAHLMGIDDADEDGNGDVVKVADLCMGCYEAWIAWLDPSRWKAGRLVTGKG